MEMLKWKNEAIIFGNKVMKTNEQTNDQFVY